MSAPESTSGSAAAALRRVGLQRHHINTGIYLGVSVLSKAASILLIPLYTSRLSRGDYAIYGLAQTLYWVAPPLFTCALSSALARFYFDHKNPVDRASVTGEIASWIILLSMLGGLAFEVVHALLPSIHLSQLEGRCLRLVVWTCVAMAIGEIPTTFFRIAESAARFAAVNLSVFAVTIGSTVYLMLAQNLGLTGLLLGMLIGQGAGALFGLGFAVVALKPSLGRRSLRPALAYSAPFIPHMIGNALMSGVDRWALELNGVHDGLGLFTLASQLTVPVQLATTAWNEASSPRFLAAWRDGGDPAARRALPRVVLGFAIAGFGALVALLLAIPLISLLVGKRFQAALPLVPWIGISLAMGAFFSAFINVLFLRKTTRIIPVLTIACVLANVALNSVLVPRWGVHGAILATGLAYTFRSGLMFIFAMRSLYRAPTVESQ